MRTFVLRVAVIAALSVPLGTWGVRAQSAPASDIAADVAVFRTQFLARDTSFSPEARREAERRLAALEAGGAARSPLQVSLELARIAALADNGHTHAVIFRLAEQYSRVPIRMLPIGADVHVVRASQDHADLLGARLVSIGGHPVARVRTEARALWGGVEHFRDQFGNSLMESPEWLHAVGLTPSDRSAIYVFATPDGQQVTRTLVGDPPSAGRPNSPPGRTLSPAPLPAEGGAWRTWLAQTAAPWALQDFEVPFRWRVAPEVDGLVVQMRRNADAGDVKIAQAIAQFRAAITQHRPRNLVLDVRWNGGGDLNTTRDFMRALPALVSGRIVVLTGPLTFSAAISSVGYLKQAAPDRVVIVGEPIGDRLVFFAEGRPVELPRSRLVIAMATKRHDYREGCRHVTDCYQGVVRHPIAVESLAPDVAAPWTAADFAAGRDSGFEAAMRLLMADREGSVARWTDDTRRASPSSNPDRSHPH